MILMFDKDIGEAMKTIPEQDFDQESVHLSKVAQIITRYIFEVEQSFDETFLEKILYGSLEALVSMIIDGPSVTDIDSDSECSAVSLTLSQLLSFNTVKSRHARRTTVGNLPHNRNGNAGFYTPWC